RMQGKVASRMPRVVVVSENSIQDIHTDMGVELDRMRLVPVGVDPDLFRPLDDVSRRPGHLITTASADVALKGLAYLLEAMAKLRADGRVVTLTIIGRPKPGKSMDLIERYGLGEAIEAMCSGTPLVATDGGALPEVTGADGETVFRCTAGDAGSLAASIAAALDNPERRESVGLAGRQRVLERWTWRRCAEMTVDQYREVLAMPENIEKLRRNGRI
ncbi:MAG: glycosyltransferase, partial [Actinobacteria bacterium]|nr:glycosyltransferase [Actinomycetota bacterium]